MRKRGRNNRVFYAAFELGSHEAETRPVVTGVAVKGIQEKSINNNDL